MELGGMSEQFYGIAFGIFNLFVAIICLFFYKKMYLLRSFTIKFETELIDVV